MSQNVEIARSIFAAWERGNFGETHWVDPGLDFESVSDHPFAASYKGLAEMATYWREWLEAWEELRVEALEYRELDEERVLVLGRFSGRGKTSGMEIGQIWPKAASLFHFQNGLVSKLVLYTDYRRALADLGLSE